MIDYVIADLETASKIENCLSNDNLDSDHLTILFELTYNEIKKHEKKINCKCKLE